MSIQINDIIRIQARNLRNGVDAVQNVYHVKHETGSPVTDTLWVIAVSAIIDAAMFGLATRMSSNITPLDLLFFNVTQDVTLPDGVWTTWAGGSSSADPNAPQVSAEVFWRTGAARVLGRKFLPPSVETENVDGNWSVALLAALAIYGAAFVGSIVTSQGNVAFGTFNKGLALFNAYATTFVPIDARTQRRRRTGVGA